MKKKHPILHSFTALLICSLLPGCGCGAVQTTAYPETISLEESVPVSEPEEEPSSVPETTEAEETASSQANETEKTVPLEETVPIEELKIIEMDVMMYAITTVNIRKEPSTDAEKIGSLSLGKSVHVTGRTEDGLWYRVDDSYKGEGFIAAEYLTDVAPVKESVPSESTQSEAEKQAAEEAARKAEEERQAEEQKRLEEEMEKVKEAEEINNNTPDEDLPPAPESSYQPGQTVGGKVEQKTDWDAVLSGEGIDTSIWEGVTGN